LVVATPAVGPSPIRDQKQTENPVVLLC